tara:strand:+ start:10718 stop:13933 length:3216 start_codon:yes stop_codon:yes gene_type:complete
MRRFPKYSLLLLTYCFLSGEFLAAKIKFNRDVRPILSENCFQCHGPDAKARKAKLRLDDKASAILERKGTRAVVPGEPNASELIHRIFSDDEDEVMPPPEIKRFLTKEQKEVLKQWIAEGAEFESHWSYSKPVRPALPEVKDKNWPKNEIDHFILSKLDAANLRPTEEADRLALVRRLSLDLTGLPPTLEEADSFARDSSPKAYEKLIDRLLDSPAYGEHWARQWLDLARYADSAGYADDQPRTIWGYRDWVIRAFNDNLPFDQFTVEQLAGDMLPEPTDDQLIATAFNRNTQTNNEGGTNDEEFRNVAVVDRVNTTMAVWMGVTMACAQCHDHKYDPISQEEYFRFFAILNNTADADRRDESPTLKAYSGEQAKKKEEMKVRIAELQKKVDALKQSTPADFEAWQRSFEISLTKSPAKFEKQGEDVLAIIMPEESFAGIQLPVLAKVEFRLYPKVGEIGKQGRFLRVTNVTKGGYLHLAEVQVFSGKENLALKGKATQISTGFDGPARYGNDGNVDGNYQKKSVFHTGQADNPWWEVDLGQESQVDKVVIWNRTDGETADRLKKFRLELLDEKRRPVWNKEIAKTPKPSHAEALDGAETLVVVPIPHANESGLYRFDGELEKKAGMTLRITSPDLAQKDPKEIFWLKEPLAKLDVPLPNQVFSALARSAKDRTPAEQETIRSYYSNGSPEVRKAEKELADFSASARQMKPQTTVPIMREITKPRKTHIQLRGDFLAKDKEVTAGLPAVFPPLPEGEKLNRLGMSRWLVSGENPLTARVVANRYWESLFGQGIVRSSEEFGSQGELPTHPELLDWLATELVRLDWDVKALLKIIVTSATYRQSSKVDSLRAEKDPFNELLSRGPRQRLSAEMIRDQALFASGLLSRKMYGPPVKPPQPNLGLKAAFGPGLDWKTSAGEDKFRRGIYVHWRRSNPYPSMATFDAPNRFVCNIRRTPTNTPLQALVTMNDPVYVEASQALARRMSKAGETNEEKIAHGFRLCLTRHPTPNETKRLNALFEEVRATYASDAAAANAMATIPIGPLPVGSNAVELASWTVVGNVLLNLDEVFLKR